MALARLHSGISCLHYLKQSPDSRKDCINPFGRNCDLQDEPVLDSCCCLKLSRCSLARESFYYTQVKKWASDIMLSACRSKLLL